MLVSAGISAARYTTRPVTATPRHEERIRLSELGDRVGDRWVAPPVLQGDPGAIGVWEASFPQVPPEVSTCRHYVELLHRALADVGDVHAPRNGVPGNMLCIAQPVGEDLFEAQGVLVCGERVAHWDSVPAVRAVGTERIDAENLPENRPKVLCVVRWVATAPAVRDANVEQSEVGVPGGRRLVEGHPAPVVVGERLLEADKLAWRPAVVGGGPGVPGGPLEQDRVVRTSSHSRTEIGRRLRVLSVGPGVEFPVSGGSGLAELRVEGKAMEAPFPPR